MNIIFSNWCQSKKQSEDVIPITHCKETFKQLFFYIQETNQETEHDKEYWWKWAECVGNIQKKINNKEEQKGVKEAQLRSHYWVQGIDEHAFCISCERTRQMSYCCCCWSSGLSWYTGLAASSVEKTFSTAMNLAYLSLLWLVWWPDAIRK